MTALRHAERTGEGQVVDLSIYEPLFWILGAQTTAHDQLGIVPSRQGSRTAFNVPRECYRTRDGRWVALSGATTATGRRILRAVGRDDLADAPWFDEITGRIAHRDEIDEAIASWVAERDNDEVLATFDAAGATVGPVYSIADIAADPHFDERGSITTVEHPALGPLRMQGLIAHLTRTPGRIRTTGALLGEHNDEILRDLLGCPPDELARLVSESVVGPTGTRPSPERAPDAPSVRKS
jgi:crotonobetainyl-CoA:carnitine CoA-transferase CaiB-like acyl-CoA transferase